MRCYEAGIRAVTLAQALEAFEQRAWMETATNLLVVAMLQHDKGTIDRTERNALLIRAIRVIEGQL